MHPAADSFIREVLVHCPELANPSRVLDCGSLDINGSNRIYFPESTYLGVDLGEGKGVDLVSPVHLLNGVGMFDLVISSEMLEHDKFWKLSVLRMLQLLEPEGLMILTCATTGRGEHGTTRSSPQDAPFTNDYYENVPEAEFSPCVEGYFSASQVQTRGTDLQFWGVRNDVDCP